MDDLGEREQAFLVRQDLFALHRPISNEDGGQWGVEFMGNTIDEIRFHLREFLLPQPVPERYEIQQDYRGDREQGQQEGGHHLPEDRAFPVVGVDIEAKGYPVAMVDAAADHYILGQVVGYGCNLAIALYNALDAAGRQVFLGQFPLGLHTIPSDGYGHTKTVIGRYGPSVHHPFFFPLTTLMATGQLRVWLLYGYVR